MMQRTAIAAALTMTMLAGCAGIQKAEGPGTDFRRGVDTIDPGRRYGDIYISAQPSDDALREFARDGGSTIINVRTESEMDRRVGYREDRLARRLGLEYVHVPVSGASMDETHAARVSDAIDGARGKVLLHCASGTRASALLATHLAMRGGMTGPEAIRAAGPLGFERSVTMTNAVRGVFMGGVMTILDDISPERIRADVDTLAGFGTRHTMSESTSDTRGVGAARRWVAKEFERAAADSNRRSNLIPIIEFDTHTVQPDGRRILREVDVVNVAMTIPGSMPEARGRLYYVVAHLDSRASEANDAESDAPGANDDASGVAVCLELARVLSKARLDSTIVLLPVTGEEQGLFGSRAHARAALEGRRDIRAVLSNDTVGDPTGVNGLEARDEIRVFSEGLPTTLVGDERAARDLRILRGMGGESDAPSRQLARYIAEVARIHDLPVKPRLVFRPDRFLRGGDHTGFNEAGFAAVRFCEVYENYDHQHQDVRVENGVSYGDLPEHVDEAYLAEVTKLNAAALIHLANAPSPPEDARVIVAELTNDTTLRWARSPEPDTAGYEIVWRATTDAEWTKAKDVGDVVEATIDLSKDNWFFGVRAYDHDGYRSPVVTPSAARE